MGSQKQQHHLIGAFEPQTPLGSRPPSPFTAKRKRLNGAPRPEDLSIFLRWTIDPPSAVKLLLIPPLLALVFAFLPIFPALAPLADARVSIPEPRIIGHGFWGDSWDGKLLDGFKIRWIELRLADVCRAFYTTANPVQPDTPAEWPVWQAAEVAYASNSYHQATWESTGALVKSPVFNPPAASTNAEPVFYAKSILDVFFVCYWIVAFSALRQVLAVWTGRRIAKWWGIRKAQKMDRYGEQFYAILYWGTMSVWGLYILSGLPTWFYKTEPLWVDYLTHWAMPKALKQYYLIQIAYWSQQLFVLVMRLEAPRKDYYELIAHHMVTIYLVTFSYLLNYTRIGHLVYISMDIPDVFLATSKLFNYMQLEIGKTVVFVMLIPVWAYFRLYLNVRLISSVWRDFGTLTPKESHFWEWESGTFLIPWLRYQICIPIALLLCLNLFWYFLVLRIAVRTVAGKALDDDRSDDEGEKDKKD